MAHKQQDVSEDVSEDDSDSTESKLRLGSDWEKNDLSQIQPINITDKHFAKTYHIPKEEIAEKIKEIGFILTDHQLGKGAYGSVMKCKSTKDEKKVFACKKMDIENIESKDFQDFKHEVFYLKRIKHENIIKCEKHFIINKSAFIILEFANEGSVDHILKRMLKSKVKTFTEEEAKVCFRDIARAIHCLHVKNGIAHRDLKLSNVLKFKNPGNKVVYKVCDFGKSRIITKQEQTVKHKGYVGTVSYMSPELMRVYIDKKLKTKLEKRVRSIDGFKSDMWALGVCLYHLVCNRDPLVRPDEMDKKKEYVKLMLKRAEDKDWSFPTEISDKLSPLCIELIQSMIEPERMLRLEILDVIRHQWIN